MTSRLAPPKRTPLPQAASLFLDSQLCFALYSTSLAMTKVYRPLLKTLGLTYPQYVVMMALWEHDALCVGDLSERVSLDSGTLVPLLRKLVALGLVLRERSTTDDRSVLISVTAAGKRLVKRAHGVRDSVACVTQCTSAEQKVLLKRLQQLRGALLQGH